MYEVGPPVVDGLGTDDDSGRRRRFADGAEAGTEVGGRQTGPIARPAPPATGPAPSPPTGYGGVTKAFHWLTVALLAVQFSIGYALDVGGQGRGRGRGRGGEPGRGRGRGGDELDVFGDDTLLSAHVVLGVTILVVAAARLLWRRRAALPPWAEGLSECERTLAHWTERSLYLLLFAVPLTGLGLVLVSDDLLALHVGAHVAFFVALAAHVGLVLKHTLVDRDRLLRRML